MIIKVYSAKKKIACAQDPGVKHKTIHKAFIEKCKQYNTVYNKYNPS